MSDCVCDLMCARDETGQKFLDPTGKIQKPGSPVFFTEGLHLVLNKPNDKL